MSKAILLLSGGLDSTLAGKVLLRMGVEVEAVNFVSPFCRCTPRSMGCSAAKKAAAELGIPVRVFACGDDYLDMIKHPRFGRGSGVNPCIDCRIFMFSRARRYMIEHEADFVATGEVLGERPMSQRLHTMQIIERESGLEGMIVRPLSARLLPASIPEQTGIVDRNRLMSFHGRSRRPQFALADKLDVKDYPCPAGGCLLTDPEYAARMRDLLAHDPGFDLHDVRLLSFGRHFRLPSGAKVIVGRNESDNEPIEKARRNGDVLLLPKEVPGPSVLCQGLADENDLVAAAGLLVAHTKHAEAFRITVKRHGDERADEIVNGAPRLKQETYAAWRVCAFARTATVAEV